MKQQLDILKLGWAAEFQEAEARYQIIRALNKSNRRCTLKDCDDEEREVDE